ncbi:MAG TPA: prolyl oligopeptidase family serine peptidase, partial [Verrucomicrobiae bacterium]|nr:prolyl oligopeptidase family serine peptidase [Verrucomicrobiae bacterium]
MKSSQFAIRTFVSFIAASAAGLMTLSPSARAGADSSTSPTNDPYIWLEDIDGSNAMKWVRSENEKTLAVLEKDLRFDTLYSEALKISEAKDRIPSPEIVHGQVLNFWRDADHVRGIWRRTTLDSYQTDSPQWTTVLDLDALAKSEKANWVWKGSSFNEPQETRCMVSLSDGGEDATTEREFDLPSGHFVENGFHLPQAKQSIAWEDADTLLVSRALTTNELTQSGYPYVVRRVKRGQALESALVVFRGKQNDTSVDPFVMTDGAGHKATFISRELTTFETEYYVERKGGFAKLALPLKLEFQALVDGKLVLRVNEDWTNQSGTVQAGSVVSIDLAAAIKNPAALKSAIIFSPGSRESVEGVAATRDALVLTILDNVRGRAFIYRAGAGGTWSRTPLDFPDNVSINIADSDIHSDVVILGAEGFLQPSSLWLARTGTQKLKLIKTLPARFDASRDVVEQFETPSTDGVKIPYFVVHPKDMKLDGENPTVMTAYGGFQISLTPNYSGTMGKLWLERGGVFVLANIRGGGEFGPAWHEAGLKTHRQIIYDDFVSVARDLMARKITSPRRLGIYGGSNGGLLMGVQFTQHPELWNAVDIGVPLLDMERFEKIQAGASWVGEYGSMSNPKGATFLKSISPYANVHRGQSYPKPFIWTTSKDDRVGPQHARKFAARLSEYGIPY